MSVFVTFADHTEISLVSQVKVKLLLLEMTYFPIHCNIATTPPPPPTTPDLLLLLLPFNLPKWDKWDKLKYIEVTLLPIKSVICLKVNDYSPSIFFIIVFLVFFEIGIILDIVDPIPGEGSGEKFGVGRV